MLDVFEDHFVKCLSLRVVLDLLNQIFDVDAM